VVLIDQKDLDLLKIAQDGVLLTSRPFQVLGDMTGISEQEVIVRLRAMQEDGIIRRFAATIGHRALGILANAMIAWKAAPEDVERAGLLFASVDEVTHCYERATAEDWPYNLYTMVHSKSRDDCLKIADQLSQMSGIREYRVLFSEFEYKKTSARI
jgi:DNA-binding Lrp family transcriptional regulator